MSDTTRPNSTAYRTANWRALRKALVADDGDCSCYLCGKRKWGRRGASKFRAHLHHLHYNTVGHESPEDVVVLCPGCHQLVHDIERRIPTGGFIGDLKAVVKRYLPGVAGL